MSKKILLITDAWEPQINGVVTTLQNLAKEAHEEKDEIIVIDPSFAKFSIHLPQYPEIKLCYISNRDIANILHDYYDHIHIATIEGSLGYQFAKVCDRLNLSYTASCHTKFPEFIKARYNWFPESIGWKFMKHAYKNAKHVITTTSSMVTELQKHGFEQPISSWTRGINRDIFYPDRKEINCGRPLLIYVGRLSHEKNIDDFCRLSIGDRATKVAIGDGPYRKQLEQRYPDVIFTGALRGKELADWYRAADCFVFPSTNDTFGVVNIEAIACGTPVAAYPVTGPVDIIENGVSGYLSWDLESAVKNCLDIPRDLVYNSSKKYSWVECYKQFKQLLVPIQ